MDRLCQLNAGPPARIAMHEIGRFERTEKGRPVDQCAEGRIVACVLGVVMLSTYRRSVTPSHLKTTHFRSMREGADCFLESCIQFRGRDSEAEFLSQLTGCATCCALYKPPKASRIRIAKLCRNRLNAP